jgi:protein TonB
MFDDFCISAASQQQARKRFGSSMAAAVLVYGTTSAAIVGATATVREVIEEKETQIAFAPPPPEPPPPPVVEAAPPPKAAPRPKVKRATLKPPDEIPLEKPKESDGPLTEAGDTGPQDGFLDGVEGGTGTARVTAPPPPPKVEKLIAPVGLSGMDDKPKYPSSAKRKGIEGLVIVSFEVLETGRVGNVRIVSGPPEFHETVLKFVATWRFKPAHRGGTPTRYRMQKPIRFRLEDA